MKKFSFLLICCICSILLNAQSGQWTWMGGEINYAGASYGTKGIADSSNRPGARTRGASWKDTLGNFWLFGGTGITETSRGGNLNDLWKFNPVTKYWTWVNGDSVPSQRSVYGTRGVAARTNKPGSLVIPVGWTDASGNFWMYGDVLWKYEPASNQWTWVQGDTAVTRAVYGTKGIAHAANKPGPSNAVEWTDASGNFWLYGSVLWKYDLVSGMWTWVHGDTTKTTTVHGTKGTPNSANTPGTRTNVMGWTDSAGRFWLFGGSGTFSTPFLYRFLEYDGNVNDLWNYDPKTNLWTWVSGNTTLYPQGSYGTLGVASPGNMPGGRGGGVSWKDQSGNFWVYGGFIYTYFMEPNYRHLNDLWKYDPKVNLWTCFRNNDAGVNMDTFDIIGMESPVTRPGARYGAVGWTDTADRLWLFGGITYDILLITSQSRLNDLLAYNTKTDRWSLEYKSNDGRQLGVYGKKGVAWAANMPGGRFNASGSLDKSGNLWLFGGRGFSNSTLFNTDQNDLWKRDTSGRWTWKSGFSKADEYSSSSPTNGFPSARANGVAWTDENNTFWLFGGSRNVLNNDILAYDEVSGKWIQKSPDGAAVYGIKGRPAAANKPKSRYNAVQWTDKAGRLWMFGGNELNDVWNFDPASNLWTWVSGDSTAGQPGVYGSKGVADAANKPGARQGAVSWSDTLGNVWIFGGVSKNGSAFFNDLWRFNTPTGLWTWISGDSTVNQKGVYGTMGTAGAANKPGSRNDAVSWMDITGKLWLFGGMPAGGKLTGLEQTPDLVLNDLWKYDPVTGQWTWTSGDSTINHNGSPAKLGVPDTTNKPGARAGAVAWTDAAGDFWLIGGAGYGWKGMGLMNDVWKFSPVPPAPPVPPFRFLDFTASRQGDAVNLAWSTAEERNSTGYTIQRSPDGVAYDSIGSVTAINSTPAVHHYRFTDNDPLYNVNHYRLKLADLNGRLTYSDVQSIVIEYTGFGFTLLQNPVAGNLMISLQTDKVMQLQLDIRNAAGHLVMTQTRQVTPGNTFHSIPVHALAAGAYYLTVRSASGYGSKQFVKQ